MTSLFRGFDFAIFNATTKAFTTCETFILLKEANHRSKSPPKSPVLPAPAGESVAESVAGEEPTSGISSREKS